MERESQMSHTVYAVKGMRVLLASPKSLAKNPDRFGSVAGESFERLTLTDGKVTARESLGITSKAIPTDAVLDAEGNPRTDADRFTFDLAKGTFTLPSGERGRSASQGATDDAINAAIAAASAARKASAKG